jgi:hypothetical protein
MKKHKKGLKEKKRAETDKREISNRQEMELHSK